MQRVVHAAGGAGQCGQQQGREEHAEDARQRGTAHGRRHVAARHRGERDGRLHGGGQGAQEQHAQVQLRRQQPAGQRLEQQPQQREQDEGAGEDRQVQAPVQHAADDRFARQARAVQEEQRGDGDGGDIVEHQGGGAFHRQQRGQADGAQQGEGEVVRSQARPPAGHGGWAPWCGGITPGIRGWEKGSPDARGWPLPTTSGRLAGPVAAPVPGWRVRSVR